MKPIDTVDKMKLIAAMAGLAGGVDIPEFVDDRRIKRQIEQENKSRCSSCLCKIPPGRGGRKCKRCREMAGEK